MTNRIRGIRSRWAEARACRAVVERLEARRLLAAAMPAVAGLYQSSLPFFTDRNESRAVTSGNRVIFYGGWINRGGPHLKAPRKVDVYDASTGQMSVGSLSVE